VSPLGELSTAHKVRSVPPRKAVNCSKGEKCPPLEKLSTAHKVRTFPPSETVNCSKGEDLPPLGDRQLLKR